MEVKKHYEVIILGAGVAGLSAALFLKRHGVNSVLVIDRYNSKNHKACSGILTEKSLKLLKEIDITPKDYKKMAGFKAYYNDMFVNIYSKSVYGYQHVGLNRISLDEQMHEQCKKEKIDIRENVSIWDLDVSSHRFNTFSFDYLIDATGFTPIANNIKKKVIGIEAKVVDKNINEKDIIPNIYLSNDIKGYAWIVKSENCQTVGLTTFYKKSINVLKVLKKFAKDHNVVLLENSMDIRAAFIPVKPLKLVKGRVAYIGERAGLTDPLTQEGIFYALYSAKKVSEAIEAKKLSLYKKEMKPVVKSLSRAYTYRSTFFKKTFQNKIWNIASKHQFTTYIFSKYSTCDFFDYTKIGKYHKEYKKNKKTALDK